jgi:hypothetical protein
MFQEVHESTNDENALVDLPRVFKTPPKLYKMI